MQQFLTFELAGRLFAVNAATVNSILDPQSWTPLPPYGSLVIGLVNVRGNVVPLFDPTPCLVESLRDLPKDAGLGLNAPSITLDATAGVGTEGGIVVFEIPNGTLLPYIGMEVEKINGVTVLTPEQIQPVPEFLPTRSARYFEGFCLLDSNPFPVIRLEELLSREALFATTGGRGG